MARRSCGPESVLLIRIWVFVVAMGDFSQCIAVYICCLALITQFWSDMFVAKHLGECFLPFGAGNSAYPGAVTAQHECDPVGLTDGFPSSSLKRIEKRSLAVSAPW